MKFDFAHLDPLHFELLCGSLLVAEGFHHVHQFAKPGQPDRGIDWVFEAPGGELWFAQVKRLLHPLSSPTLLRRFLDDLERGLALLPAEKALLILSVALPPNMGEQFHIGENIEIWDGEVISQLLEKHPKVQQGYFGIVNAQHQLTQIIEGQDGRRDESGNEGERLLSRLKGVAPGRADWRAYEDVCIEILNYLFIPPLRPPKIQSRTEDGLDRRDAIYPLGAGNAFWESIKYEHSSRMIVAEFKNYVGPIGQGEVESLGQYLLPKAKRSFGILCSREAPSDSALKARRRAWMIAENIILFLSDGDLAEMVRIRASDGDPSEVLDAQMDEFFIKLAP